ncbi:diguanylate cyclase [Vibrio sp. 99-70-13A1]|uniref:sensor domain-containing diguanylate cyclase n=1 Tax=Vibrio sp. 99-70-13A1 TaxID=2607601 RepID=UPI00149384C0|nr:diguanylate cyclase [Vibrio sp. 99-70-13A1]NOH96930.1 diguanylate cyclase [Vibrio sp. 99-70-13A1]
MGTYVVPASNSTTADLEVISLLTQLHGDKSTKAIKFTRNQLMHISSMHNVDLAPLYEQYLNAVDAFGQGDLSSATMLFKAFVNHKEMIIPASLVSYANIYLGSIFASQGDFYLSLSHFTKAETDTRTTDHQLALFLNLNIGSLYISLGDYEKALEYSESAVGHGAHVNTASNTSLALCNLALSLANTNNLEKALETIKAATKLSLDEGFMQGYALSQFYYALILSLMGKTREAFEAYKTAFELIKSHADTYLKIEFYSRYSEFLLECGHVEFTITFCQKALKSNGINGNKRIKLSLLNTLVDCYKKTEDTASENQTLRQVCELYKELADDWKNNEVSYANSILHHSKVENEVTNSELFTRHLSHLNELGQLIANTEDKPQDMLRLFESIGELIPCSAFSLALFRKDRNVLDYKYLVEEGEFQQGFEVECDEVSRIGIYALKHNATVVLDTSSDTEIGQYLDVSCSPKGAWINGDLEDAGTSVICTPVTFNGEILGVISIQKNQSYAFQDFHVQVATQLASYIAVSLKNLYQHQELEDNRVFMEQIYLTDHLTGLKNRFALKPYLEDLREKRDSSVEVSTVLLDVDYLKAFNNEYGMTSGDDLLVTLANILRHVAKDRGDVFRIGGDEFAVVLPAPVADLALTVAQEIKSHLKLSAVKNRGAGEDVVSTEGEDALVTCTIGVMDPSIVTNTAQFEQSILVGERALIKAKKNQRNRLLRYAYSN